jgi:hypothetical protein
MSEVSKFEQVAVAIAGELLKQGIEAREVDSGAIARAAIAAMRYATLEMMQAGDEALGSARHYVGSEAVYVRMIDEALKE